MACLIVFHLRSVNNGCGNFSKLLDIWKYSEADARANSFMNIYYLEMSAREMWHILSCKVVFYISELRQNK